jgi:hypothetical protein
MYSHCSSSAMCATRGVLLHCWGGSGLVGGVRYICRLLCRERNDRAMGVWNMLTMFSGSCRTCVAVARLEAMLLILDQRWLMCPTHKGVTSVEPLHHSA